MRNYFANTHFVVEILRRFLCISGLWVQRKESDASTCIHPLLYTTALSFPDVHNLQVIETKDFKNIQDTRTIGSKRKDGKKIKDNWQ